MSDPDIESAWAGAELPEPQKPEPLPTGRQLTELDDAFRATPYPRLQILRARAPVQRDAELGCVVLTRHDDVRDALANTALWRDPAHAHGASPVLGVRFAADHPAASLALDGPAHRAWRAPLAAVLSQATVAALVPRIDAVIKLILDDLDENEFEFDAYTKYALRVAVSVLADLLGVPRDRWMNFRIWATQLSDEYYTTAPTAAERDRASTARAELAALFSDAVAARRCQPEADLVSALLFPPAPHPPPTDEAVIRQCLTLLIAGLAPTAALLGNALHSLLQHTRQMNRVREQPELLGNAIEEILRFNAPVISTLRIAHADMSIGGCPVRHGEPLLLSLASANRDAATYSNPDVADVSRLDTHHHAFGGGDHCCVGAQLARTIAQLAVYGLITRFEDLELSPLGWEFAARRSLRILRQFWVRS